MNRFRSFARSLAVSLAILLMSGCAPRGETKSLQQVLEAARSQYVELVRNEKSEPLKATLIDLAKNLEDMVAANGESAPIASATSQVVDKLSALIATAGYTSRASMGEILMQHRVVLEDASRGTVNSARIKLLAARTYSLLSSELATTRFAVHSLAKGA
jgi:hypothetical protein